jgi:PAS domain S-box-containing protein
MNNIKLENSELRYRRLFETAQDGILLVDFETGMIVDVNPFLIKMLDYSKEDFLKKYLWEVGVFKDIAASKVKFKALQKKKYIRFENLPLETKSGKKINVEFVSNAYKVDDETVIQCNIRDITDRKKTEELLKISNLRFEELFNNMTGGVVVYDAIDNGNDFIIKDFNHGAEKIEKISKEKILGKRITEVFKGAKDFGILKAFKRVWQSGKAEYFSENIYIGNKNVETWRENWIFKLPTGEITAVYNDITKRKEIEEKLRKSEEKFSKIFETSPTAIIITHMETGKFVDLNDAFVLMTGFNRQEILNSSTLEIGLWANEKDREHLVADLYAGRRVLNQEYIYRKKDGTFITITMSAFKIQLDDDPCIISNIVDITEHKKAERLLIEKNQMFNQVIETIPTRIFWKDKNLNFLGCNSLFAKDSGKKSANELIGHNDFQMGWKQEGSLYQKDDMEVITSGKSKIDYEEPQQNKNGKIKWLQTSKVPLRNSNNEIVGVLGMYTDITERKKTEQLINEIKNRDEAMLGSIGDGVFATDVNGKIILFNRMTEQMTGIRSAEAIGRPYNQIINFVKEIDGQPSNDFIAEAIESNKITKMANHIMLARKDGNNIPVADSAAPIKGFDGKIIGCVVVFHDVTKEREIDKAKTEFVSLASHQLRTPLSTINWYCEMLLSEDVGKLKPKQRQYSQEVYHASQRMVALVNALLNVSRLEMGTFAIEPKLIDISDIAKTCIKELKPQILRKKLVINQKYGKKTSSIKVDPKLVTIIFQNFLSNSVKYTKNNGNIGLTVSKEKNVITIAVSDTGIGIPKNQQKDIWEKLFRADNAKITDPDGSGLGLYIVKKIVDYIGGKVWFKPNKNRGTTFYASFPLSGMIKKTGDKNLILYHE